MSFSTPPVKGEMFAGPFHSPKTKATGVSTRFFYMLTKCRWISVIDTLYDRFSNFAIMNLSDYRNAVTEIYPLDDRRVVILFLNKDGKDFESIEIGIIHLDPNDGNGYYRRSLRIDHEKDHLIYLKGIGVVFDAKGNPRFYMDNRRIHEPRDAIRKRIALHDFNEDTENLWAEIPELKYDLSHLDWDPKDSNPFVLHENRMIVLNHDQYDVAPLSRLYYYDITTGEQGYISLSNVPEFQGHKKFILRQNLVLEDNFYALFKRTFSNGPVVTCLTVLNLKTFCWNKGPLLEFRSFPNHIAFSDDNRSILCFCTEKGKDDPDDGNLTIYRAPTRHPESLLTLSWLAYNKLPRANRVFSPFNFPNLMKISAISY